MLFKSRAVAAAASSSGEWGRFWQRRSARITVGVLGLIALACVVGPWLLPWSYEAMDFDHVAAAPGVAGHWFGTDSVGRDLLARTLQGGRISLLVGAVASVVSLLLGVSWGLVAGYLGGRVDALMMRLVDVLYALPFMFFVILLMVVFGRHLVLIFVAIGAIQWLDMARIVRGQTLSLRHREFILAARMCGQTPRAIIIEHLLPNVLGVVIVHVTLMIPQVIMVESFLSFLGLGVQEPQTSWGALVNEGAADMQAAPWALVFPALFLGVTLLAFNFLGDALRDALDPRLAGSGR